MHSTEFLVTLHECTSRLIVNEDWKLHFPIEQQDLPVAWRILAQEFVKHECLSGMKAN